MLEEIEMVEKVEEVEGVEMVECFFHSTLFFLPLQLALRKVRGSRVSEAGWKKQDGKGNETSYFHVN